MVDYICEVSKSNKAECRCCKNKIQMGMKRLVYFYTYRTHQEKYYYCVKCGVDLLKEEIKQLNRLIGDLTNGTRV